MGGEHNTPLAVTSSLAGVIRTAMLWVWWHATAGCRVGVESKRKSEVQQLVDERAHDNSKEGAKDTAYCFVGFEHLPRSLEVVRCMLRC